MVSRVRAGVPFARALVVMLAALLAGCGGSGNGVASKSAAEILAASRTAALSASSVHVVVKASQGKLSLTSEMELAKNGSRRRTSLLGETSEVISIGDTAYARRGSAFYKRLAKRTGAHVPQGTWLKSTAEAQKPGQTELDGELNLLLRSTGPLTKGATRTIDGQKTIELKETAKLFTGAIYIATTGRPYPIEIVKHGRETGQTTFSGWNQAISLAAPANAIELSKLEKR